jgi:hypothetical protein
MELPHPLAFENLGAALSMGLTPGIWLKSLFIKLIVRKKASNDAFHPHVGGR